MVKSWLHLKHPLIVEDFIVSCEDKVIWEVKFNIYLIVL